MKEAKRAILHLNLHREFFAEIVVGMSPRLHST
jgi:hypothetical protein